MKHKMEINLYTINNNDESLHIIAKLNFQNILKEVNNFDKLKKYKSIDVSIMNVIPKQNENTHFSFDYRDRIIFWSTNLQPNHPGCKDY